MVALSLIGAPSVAVMECRAVDAKIKKLVITALL